MADQQQQQQQRGRSGNDSAPPPQSAPPSTSTFQFGGFDTSRNFAVQSTPPPNQPIFGPTANFNLDLQYTHFDRRGLEGRCRTLEFQQKHFCELEQKCQTEKQALNEHIAAEQNNASKAREEATRIIRDRDELLKMLGGDDDPESDKYKDLAKKRALGRLRQEHDEALAAKDKEHEKAMVTEKENLKKEMEEQCRKEKEQKAMDFQKELSATRTLSNKTADSLNEQIRKLKNDRMNQVEGVLGQLREAKQNLEKANEDLKTAKTEANEHRISLLDQHTREMVSLEDKRNQLASGLRQATDELNQARADRANVPQQHETTSELTAANKALKKEQEAHQALISQNEARTIELSDVKETLKQEREANRTRISQHEAVTAELHNVNDLLKHEREAHQARIQQHEATTTQLHNLNNALEQEQADRQALVRQQVAAGSSLTTADNTLKQENEDQRSQIARLNGDLKALKDSSNSQGNEYHNRISALEQELTACQDHGRERDEEIKRLVNKIRELEKHIERLESQLGEAERDHKTIFSDREKIRKDLATTSQKHSQMTRSLKDIREDKNGLNQQITGLQGDLRRSEEVVQAIEEERDNAIEAAAAHQIELDQKEEQYRESTGQLQTQIKELEGELEGMNDALVEKDGEIEGLQRTAGDLRKENSALKQKMEKVKRLEQDDGLSQPGNRDSADLSEVTQSLEDELRDQQLAESPEHKTPEQNLTSSDMKSISTQPVAPTHPPHHVDATTQTSPQTLDFTKITTNLEMKRTPPGPAPDTQGLPPQTPFTFTGPDTTISCGPPLPTDLATFDPARPQRPIRTPRPPRGPRGPQYGPHDNPIILSGPAPDERPGDTQPLPTALTAPAPQIGPAPPTNAGTGNAAPDIDANTSPSTTTLASHARRAATGWKWYHYLLFLLLILLAIDYARMFPGRALWLRPYITAGSSQSGWSSLFSSGPGRRGAPMGYTSPVASDDVHSYTYVAVSNGPGAVEGLGAFAVRVLQAGMRSTAGLGWDLYRYGSREVMPGRGMFLGFEGLRADFASRGWL